MGTEPQARWTQLHGVLQQASDAIITIDVQQRVVFFNRAAEQVFGVAAHEGQLFGWPNQALDS